MDVLLTGMMNGGDMLNYAKFVSFKKDFGHINGVEFKDRLTGTIHTV